MCLTFTIVLVKIQHVIEPHNFAALYFWVQTPLRKPPKDPPFDLYKWYCEMMEVTVIKVKYKNYYINAYHLM